MAINMRSEISRGLGMKLQILAKEAKLKIKHANFSGLVSLS